MYKATVFVCVSGSTPTITSHVTASDLGTSDKRSGMLCIGYVYLCSDIMYCKAGNIGGNYIW